MDESSTEFSIVGQTSSISTSTNLLMNSVGLIGDTGPDIGSTKHYVPVTQIPKIIQKRTGNVADTKIKVS